MKDRQPTEESFLKDVRAHVMMNVRDDDLYRHIRFREPGTYHMHFDLVTWPGYLAYSGDMGSFMFTRIEDMFQFFRDSRGTEHTALRINVGYWGEKAVAVSKNEGGIKTYSADLFRENIERWLTDREASDEVRQAVEDEVLHHADDGEYPAIRAAVDFEGPGKFRFTDFWEVDHREYTYHFVWACYAIAWGIRMYDKAKTPA